MYKFDCISNLNEMKELCFYIKAINSAINANKYNPKDLMPTKLFIEKEYNLEISLSKLYLFKEKIHKLCGTKNKFPTIKELDKIIKGYIKFCKDKLKECELEVLKEELNLKDAKYEVKKDTYKSAEELAKDISVSRKIYYTNNSWLVILSAVISLFCVSLLTLIMGTFFPTFFTMFLTKAQELTIMLLLFVGIFFIIYALCIYGFATYTYNLGKKIKAYNKYSGKILSDYNKFNNAQFLYNNLLKELSVGGIEFSDKLIYSYLSETDDIDLVIYNEKKKTFPISTLELKDVPPIGIVLSKKEQDYSWLNSKVGKIEKSNINRELVHEINLLIGELKAKKLTNADITQNITSFYCNELSVNKRKDLIDDAESKLLLSQNYINLMDKINSFKALSIFDGSDVRAIRKINMIEEAEMQSFKDYIGAMCDRIEKAGKLNLISEGYYKTYEIIKKEIDMGVIYGEEIDKISVRYDLIKLFIRLHKELSVLDSLM